MNKKIKRSSNKLNKKRSLKGGKQPKSNKKRSSKNNKRSRRVIRRNKKGSKGGASPSGESLSVQANIAGDNILPRQDLALTPGAGIGIGRQDSWRADSRPVSGEESLGRQLEKVNLGVRPDSSELLLAKLINFIKNPENSIFSGGKTDLKHYNVFISI